MTGSETSSLVSFSINPPQPTNLSSFFSTLDSFSVQLLVGRSFPPLFAWLTLSVLNCQLLVLSYPPTGLEAFTESLPMLQVLASLSVPAVALSQHPQIPGGAGFAPVLQRWAESRKRDRRSSLLFSPRWAPPSLRNPRVRRRGSGRNYSAAHADMAALVVRSARDVLKRAHLATIPRRHRHKKKWVRSGRWPRREQRQQPFAGKLVQPRTSTPPDWFATPTPLERLRPLFPAPQEASLGSSLSRLLRFLFYPPFCFVTRFGWSLA